METNILYYGDNLEILRKYIPDESVDLIYLDPPFNSKATYNVLYKELTGQPSQAQITAFEDTWQWGTESEIALQEIASSGIAPQSTKELMSVLSNFVGKKTSMRAYLTMMCIRLVELRRVLKDTGSIYLHCDPTASHYLKIMLDTIFSPKNFRNEIIWKRSSAHSDIGQGAKHLGRLHDVLLFYSKSDNFTCNMQFTLYDKEYTDSFYNNVESGTGRKYTLDNIAGPMGAAKGNPQYEFLGVTRYWRYSRERMQELYKQGRIVQTKPGTVPRYKRYLDEMPGVSLQDIWDDLLPIGAQAKERLGYPTQKPLSLLERIVKYSSNEGDIVLDPFCGCGTALVAAQKLNRKWIGIDVTHLAISTMKWRLEKIFPNIQYKVVGEPKDLESAVELAKQDKYQFQWWAVSLVGGQPYGDKKKGADTGIDGYLYFMDEKDKIKKAIISVKSGNVSVSQVRDLIGVVKREKAEMGVFLTLESITKPMEQEAVLEGFYHSPLVKDYRKIQIFTIADVLTGKKPEIPPWISPIATPAPINKAKGKTGKLL